MTRLAERDRRALVLGGVILVLAFAVARGIPTWASTWSTSGERAAMERRALVDARAIVAAEKAMRDSLLARRARLHLVWPSVIDAPDPSAAASRLSALVSTAATNAGIAVGSVAMRSDTSTIRGLNRPRVVVDARGDVSGLMQFLLLLEMGPPLMHVTALTVAQAEPGGAGRAEELRLTLGVEAVARLTPADTVGVR